jgi:hypothetical protein
MKPRRVWIVASVFVVMLALPRIAHAGIGEFIWEMSGPQFEGGGLECKFALSGALQQCYAIIGLQKVRVQPRQHEVRLSFEGAGYFSTGKNSEGTDYEFGQIWMLAFDPMLEYVSLVCDSATFYHGFMGVSYNLFLGKGFDPFPNVAFKLRPIGVKLKSVAFEYNIRLYPNRFTPDEFGKDPLPTTNGRAEAVHSFSVLIPIG